MPSSSTKYLVNGAPEDMLRVPADKSYSSHLIGSVVLQRSSAWLVSLTDGSFPGMLDEGFTEEV